MPSLRSIRLAGLVVCFITVTACMPRQQTIRTSALDFLYPQGSDAVQPSDVTLQIPVRVGIAFAPAIHPGTQHALTEDERLALLERVATAFEGRESIASIEVIPSTYLQPQGSFANLDQLRSALGVDLVTLVSYDQTQFTTSTGRSIAYWTIIGAYVVKGEKNETSTVLEAVVYDIPSRALLFRAAGTSQTGGRATAVGSDRKTRKFAQAGFEEATEDLIGQFATALAAFEEQAKRGTVRGPGTPALHMVDASGSPYGQGSGGAGAFGAWEMAWLAGLLTLAVLPYVRRRRT